MTNTETVSTRSTPKSTRWNSFRMCSESIPSSAYEAAIFLSNAFCHLRNSHEYTDALGDAFDIINKAHQQANKEILAEVA